MKDSSQHMTRRRSSYDSILDRLLDVCFQVYGSRLISLVVFGSVGRGMMKPDSDIDILIIADPLPKGRIPRVREFDAVEQILDDYMNSLADTDNVNTCLSPVLKTPREVRSGSLLFLDMLEDSRVLFDKDGVFKKHMDRLSSQLDHLGARRIWNGDQWYWDLKPDYEIGEVFSL